MFGFRTVAVLAVVAFGGIVSSPMAAASSVPVTISLTGCLIDGGSETVSSDTPIVLLPSGFAEGTHGLITDFFGKEQTTLTITEAHATTVTDISDTWGPAEQLDKHLWVTHPAPFDLGSLTSRTNITVTEQISFTQPLLVAFPPVKQSGDNGPFLIRAEQPITCDIQAG